jgi:hypothetical protein
MTDSLKLKPKGKRRGGSYKPGVSGNPNGRPKGAYCERTLRNIELHKEAAEYMPRWLDLLKELCEDKYEWAIKAFGDKFVKRPENEGCKTIHIKDLATANTAEQINSLIAKTPEFGELTLKEAVEYLKVLSGIKANEVAESVDTTNRLSQETLFKQFEAINNVIDIKRELEQPK